MSSFFVAGTDTDVGKTTACRAIIQALQAKGIRIVGYKPIACSCEESIYPVDNQSNEPKTDYDAENNSDVLTLMDATNESVSYQEVNSYTFTHSLPMLTRDKSRIKLSKINQHWFKNINLLWWKAHLVYSHPWQRVRVLLIG